MKTITKTEWEAKHPDFKSTREDGTRCWNEMDESGATVSVRVFVLACPKCEGEDIRITENVSRDYGVSVDDGVLTVLSWDCKTWDESSTGEVLYCRSCDHEFPIPAGVWTDWR